MSVAEPAPHRRRWPSGVVAILIATAIAGGCGYIVTAVVGATRPADEYADFGVFWATLYLVIAALSGVQQEVTRATRPVSAAAAPHRHVAVRFGVVSALIIAALLLITAIWWAPALFGGQGWALAVPIALGSAGYVVVAVLAGTLYGLTLWSAIARMIALDGILRLVGVLAVIALGGDIGALAWAVVIPFPLTPLLLWWSMRSDVAGSSELDVGPRRLTWNVGRTVVASVAVGVLVSGFPLLVRLAFPEASAASIGSLVFAINIVRAPLVIVVLALQSYLIVRFRSQRAHAGRAFLSLAALVIAASVVLAVAAVFAVPAVLSLLWPDYVLSGWFFGALVATSGLLGLLCLSGPLTLARSQHAVYALGWIVAAVSTVGVLLIPGPIDVMVIVALTIGPILGVAVHLVGTRLVPHA